jgi:excisionase family DNA binding protein
MVEILTVNQVARLLNRDMKTIRRYIVGGQIKAFKVGRDWRIEQAELERFLNKNKNLDFQSAK